MTISNLSLQFTEMKNTVKIKAVNEYLALTSPRLQGPLHRM